MGSTRSRAESAADIIAAAAQRIEAGARIGSREELRARCGVSVGTLHEALRLLQATGEIVVRPGPGGGVFAGKKSALSSMLRDLQGDAVVEPTFAEVARVLDALAPLLFEDAIAALDESGARRLEAGLSALVDAGDADLFAVVRASLEMFATVVSLPPTGIVGVMAASLLRTQIAALPDVVATIDPDWRDLVDAHIAAVSRMIHALQDHDLDTALEARHDPGFIAIFAAIAHHSGALRAPRLLGDDDNVPFNDSHMR